MGRFINADSYTSTGQGILGNNMFAYCNNNPCNYFDADGREFVSISVVVGAIVVFCLFVPLMDWTARGFADLLQELLSRWQYAHARILFTSEEAEETTDQKKEKKRRNSLDVEGEPNSDEKLYDEKGNLKQERHYDSDGKAEYDIDYSHSGDYDFPHMHTWDWNVVPPRSGHIPLPK